jgi:hypothetical protein
VPSVDSVIGVADDATTLTVEPSTALTVMVDPLIDVMVLPVLGFGPELVVVDVGLVEQVLVEVAGLTVMLGPEPQELRKWRGESCRLSRVSRTVVPTGGADGLGLRGRRVSRRAAGRRSPLAARLERVL